MLNPAFKIGCLNGTCQWERTYFQDESTHRTAEQRAHGGFNSHHHNKHKGTEKQFICQLKPMAMRPS